MPPERLAPRRRQGRRGRTNPGCRFTPAGLGRPKVEGVDTPSSDLPPQTVRRDLADARGWGEYTAAGNTGHKFFEIGLRGPAGLGVAKMNACRLGHRKWGESPQPSCSKYRVIPASGDLCSCGATEVPAFAGMTLWVGQRPHPSPSVMAGLDPATQMHRRSARKVRLGPRIEPRIKSGDADDGTERLDDRPEEPG